MWYSYLVLLALNFHDIIFDFMRQSVTDGFWRWGLSLLQLPWTDYSLRTVLASLNAMRVLTDSGKNCFVWIWQRTLKNGNYFLTGQKLIKPLEQLVQLFSPISFADHTWLEMFSMLLLMLPATAKDGHWQAKLSDLRATVPGKSQTFLWNLFSCPQQALPRAFKASTMILFLGSFSQLFKPLCDEKNQNNNNAMVEPTSNASGRFSTLASPVEGVWVWVAAASAPPTPQLPPTPAPVHIYTRCAQSLSLSLSLSYGLSGFYLLLPLFIWSIHLSLSLSLSLSHPHPTLAVANNNDVITWTSEMEKIDVLKDFATLFGVGDDDDDDNDAFGR